MNGHIESVLAPFWSSDDGLTPSERAEAFGIDLSLVDDNLRLSPEQRLDQNQAALDLMAALVAARTPHGKPQGTPL